MEGIYFSSILDAMSYRKQCPFCLHNLDFSDSDLICRDMESGEVELDAGADNTIIVNIHNQQIEIKEKMQFPVISGDGAIVRKTYSKLSNREFFRIKLECPKCSCYSIAFQLIIDLINNRMEPLVLNSETFTIEDLDTKYVHEIRNVYSTQETEYTFYPKVGSSDEDKSYTFPLIPLDLTDPYHTLRRIKTLLVFS